MTKFYQELKNNLYLPVKSDRPILPFDMVDPYFYIKYSKLFGLIEELNFKSNCSNMSLLAAISLNKMNLYSLLMFNLKYLYDLGFDYKSMHLYDLERFLLIWGECFDYMYELGFYHCEKCEYLEYMELFNNAVNEILLAQRKIIKVRLPNTWLISSNDGLFNTFSKKHLDATFSNLYNRYNQLFYDAKLDFQGGEELNQVKLNLEQMESGFVTPLQIKNIAENGECVSFNGKVFDSKYFNLVKAALELEKDYYSFLKRLFVYTDEPIKQLDKVRKLKGDNYDDVLVSCCGVSKVNSGSSKSVVTGSFNYKKKFEEYSIRGYTISFCVPLKFNYEQKCIDEYPEQFLTIRSLR